MFNLWIGKAVSRKFCWLSYKKEPSWSLLPTTPPSIDVSWFHSKIFSSAEVRCHTTFSRLPNPAFSTPPASGRSGEAFPLREKETCGGARNPYASRTARRPRHRPAHPAGRRGG